MAAPTFMIIPSLACQASCKYCFGPYEGTVMDERTAKETVGFIYSIALESTAHEVSVIFHGGEPLLAPVSVWEVLFDEIKTRLAGFKVKLSLQSNLWKLDEDFLRLFRENGVAIGTSLDGPRELCDLNRGDGYFDYTHTAIKKAKAAGMSVSAIATITKQTLPHAREIARYFRNNGMPLVLHGALSAIDDKDSPYALNAGEYACMIKDLFQWYIKNRKHIQIDTLDHFVRGVVTGNPGVCTFRDCFGMFLSISPNGEIASCQRLAGKEGFVMGNVFDRPTLAALHESEAAKAQRGREKQARERCAGCGVYPICKGGCYYSALASGNGVIDPLCEAYKEIHAFVQEKIMEEMGSSENIEAIASRPATRGEHPLLRKGAYISLAGKAHPARIADNAMRVLALYELSKTKDPRIAAQNLYDQKICGDIATTEKLLSSLRNKFDGSAGAGTVFESGLNTVWAALGFPLSADLPANAAQKCRDCEYRYLCGGALRAGEALSLSDMKDARARCGRFKERAEKLTQTARKYLANL